MRAQRQRRIAAALEIVLKCIDQPDKAALVRAADGLDRIGDHAGQGGDGGCRNGQAGKDTRRQHCRGRRRADQSVIETADR